MAVYVDQLHYYSNRGIRNGDWCHLFADTIEELHGFAVRCGVQRVWFQEKKHPHYDLTKGARRVAIINGAIEITTKEYLRKQKGEQVCKN